MTGSSVQRQWYARRDGAVRGPFLDEYVGRYILLGRIRLNDELSQDRKTWQPVTNFPDLFPEELSGLSSWDDYHKIVMARIKYDERVSDRRRNNGMQPPGEDRRKLPDRRRAGSNAEFFRGLLQHNISISRQRNAGYTRQSLREFLLAALLACLMVAYLSSALR